MSAALRREFETPLAYALRWRVSGVLPGAHAGTDSGHSGRFREVVPFDRSPDPRRIDLRATVRDPFGLVHVRQFEQRAAARVEVLLDISASMRFGSDRSHLEVATELTIALSKAAYSVHDAFGFALCGATVELAQSVRRGASEQLLGTLRSIRPVAPSARGLLQAAHALIGRRRLVFLVSDFAYPLEELATVLDALAKHDVVPVYIRNDVRKVVPRWGLTELTDLETGRKRFLWLRPALLQRWAAQAAQRRERINRLCATRGRRPFVLEGRFSAFELADYLLAT